MGFRLFQPKELMDLSLSQFFVRMRFSFRIVEICRCAYFNVSGVTVSASTLLLSMVHDIRRVRSKPLINMADLAMIF
jgi:hypothetical protein